MDSEVTLTLSLSATIAQEVLAFIAARKHSSAPIAQQTSIPSSPATTAKMLASLLHGSHKKLARFLVAKQGHFYNHELAKEMGVIDRLTSTPLGHLTRKLRKVGVSAEGHTRNNWYTTNRVSGRTLVNVRPDVLEVLRQAVK